MPQTSTAAPAGPDPTAATPPLNSASTGHSLVATRAGRLGLVLAAQAELLASASRDVAAHRLADLLVARLGFDRVALAFVDGDRLQAPLLNGGQRVDPNSPLGRSLLTALHEALDQRQALVTPAPRDESLAPIRVAQQQLMGATGGLVLTLPLLAPPEVEGASGPGEREGTSPGLATAAVAVLCAQHFVPTTAAAAAEEAAALDHVAAFAAPVLALLSMRDRSSRHRVAGWWQGGGSLPARRVRRLGVAASVLGLAVAFAWPVAWQVGAPAQVEGLVQRVVAAPAAGFLLQVHVRPGDVVTEGQLLLEMADRELQAERERWSAQLLQAEAAVAEANARADRAQLMLQWARVSEAQAQLDLVESQIARTRIVAPFDAVVAQGDLTQSLGAPVQAGAELLTLVPQGQFRVMLRVDEGDMPLVAVGQIGQLAVSALPWDPLGIKVVRVTPMAHAKSGSNVFDVEAELLSPPRDLRPGLSGHARLDVGERPWGLGLVSRGLQQLRLLWWQWWG